MVSIIVSCWATSPPWYLLGVAASKIDYFTKLIVSYWTTKNALFLGIVYLVYSYQFSRKPVYYKALV